MQEEQQEGEAKARNKSEKQERQEPTEQRSYKDETDFPELALKYWADPRIHGWGNVGSSGAVHAFLAPTFTAGLDAFAYGGLDTRDAVWKSNFRRPTPSTRCCTPRRCV